ncbi:MAG: NAD-dependent epimerase/dehydratase family protein [Betaproteobacteria bacterium]|nr:MAG: NAD-dependent epimerase/dehydratase family protein [Betaproteobacteria bacterium]
MTDPTHSTTRVALLAGATGLVGRALLHTLLDSPRYALVHALLRRAAPSLATSEKLTLHSVDFNALPPVMPAVDDVYIALGTTIKAAGSEAAFRHVDFDAVVNTARAAREAGATNLATARAAREAGATNLAVVSGLGANAKSRVFYNRVKGEMQDAVSRLGYTSVVIAQPSLLVGDRAALGQPPRAGEEWTMRMLRPVMPVLPSGVRPIDAAVVARALVQATLAARPGVHILSSAAMQSMRS